MRPEAFKLLCDRPLAKDVDFDTAQFVVAYEAGLNVNGRRLQRGELVPVGALSTIALRQEYEYPRIELLEHALHDESLSAAYYEHNPPAQAGAAVPVQGSMDALTAEALDKYDRRELARVCEQHGLPSTGNWTQLRKRLGQTLGF